MNFIPIEHDVHGLRASTIRGEVCGIRFFHIVSGKNDFTDVGLVGGISLKGLAARNKNVNRRLPFNTELLDFSRHKLNVGERRKGGECDRVWIATLVGFMFLLRASEMADFSVTDMTFGEYAGKRYVRISIRKSITDQEEIGAFRSLNGTVGTSSLSTVSTLGGNKKNRRVRNGLVRRGYPSTSNTLN